MLNQKPSIVLASTSPRRRQLMAEAGYEFLCVAPGVDESSFCSDGLSAADYAERLAVAKANSVAGGYPDSLVIGADTVVDFDGEIIGKASNAQQAERITRRLFSRAHKVITAIALVRRCDGVEVVASDTTAVYPKKLTEQQIAAHVAGGSWRGKAGAYAIQSDGDEFVERIDGSVTNVMGLSMELLERLLKKCNCPPH